MPELPDVEKFLNYFEENALKKEITDVEVSSKKTLKNSNEEELKELLVNDSFTSAERYGKWLIITTKKGNCLAMHFGMTGFLELTKDEDEMPHSARVAFSFHKNQKLYFVDQRKFGGIEVIKDKNELIKKHKLGTDALQMKWEEFKELFKGKRGMVKTALMNQAVISGIGNVYADEILLQAGIQPDTLLSHLTERRLKTLYTKINKVLSMAIKHHADPEEFPGNYMIPHRKKGEKWPACHGKVKTQKVGGRTTYFCPEVQTKY